MGSWKLSRIILRAIEYISFVVVVFKCLTKLKYKKASKNVEAST